MYIFMHFMCQCLLCLAINFKCSIFLTNFIDLFKGSGGIGSFFLSRKIVQETVVEATPGHQFADESFKSLKPSTSNSYENSNMEISTISTHSLSTSESSWYVDSTPERTALGKIIKSTLYCGSQSIHFNIYFLFSIRY